MASTTYMIVAGASVVVVRDGKRKTILPGGGLDFTDAEIKSIRAGQPGALRKPINEGRGKSEEPEDDADAAEGEDTKTVKKTTGKKASGKKTAAKKPAETPAPDADDDGDDDEDI